MRKSVKVIVLLFVFSACSSTKENRNNNLVTFDIPISTLSDKTNKITTVNVYKEGTTSVMIEPQYSEPNGKNIAFWIRVVSERTVGIPLDDNDNNFVFKNIVLSIDMADVDGKRFADSFGYKYVLQDGQPLSEREINQAGYAKQWSAILPPKLFGTMSWNKGSNLLIFTEDETNRKWQRNSN